MPMSPDCNAGRYIRRLYRAAAPVASLMASLTLTLALLLPAAGQAQTALRSVVVPAEAGIVVPPRGQPQPRLVAPPAPRAAATLPEAALAEAPAPLQLAPAGGIGLAAPLGAMLPLAAAALLGSGVIGGGSGGSGTTASALSGGAPVRTSR